MPNPFTNKKNLGRFTESARLIDRKQKRSGEIIFLYLFYHHKKKGGVLQMNHLIQKSRQGDPDAFEELMQSHMQNMYKAAKAILRSDEDVADAIQETILSCWEKLWQLKQDQYFSTWMTRILINNCKDILKKRQPYLADYELQDPSSNDTGFENVEWNQVLNSIDEKYRLVILLYYVEGFKTSEISQILGIPESTVRTRLARGRKKMSEIYQLEERRVSS